MKESKLKSLAKSGENRAKHYEPKLKIYGSFEKIINTLVAEPKKVYKK
ncbi:hypothetical protein EZS27_017327 [termite gut metagenome]|uniref:Uncharacterized protein n=1 Tax=termite gut metagenome TaxID=433724 RepID=A0A5J4RL26_9ZZZZ